MGNLWVKVALQQSISILIVSHKPADIITRAEVVSVNLLLRPRAEGHCLHALKSESWLLGRLISQGDQQGFLQIITVLACSQV